MFIDHHRKRILNSPVASATLGGNSSAWPENGRNHHVTEVSDVFSNYSRFSSGFVPRLNLGHCTQNDLILIFKVIFKVKPHYRILSRNYLSSCTNMVSNDGNLSEQLTQPWPLPRHLTFKVKLKVELRGTGYRHENTSVHVPNVLK